MTNVPLRLLSFFFSLALLALESCNSPFQPQQVYSPQLVLYCIAFHRDSTLVIRVDASSRTSVGDSSESGPLSGLEGTLTNEATGESTELAAKYTSNTNLLSGRINLVSGMTLSLQVRAVGYETCSSSLTVLDSGIIYPTYYTSEVMRDPSAAGQPEPQFTVYPSHQAAAIRLTMALIYRGIGPDGTTVSGEIDLNPSYQQDTTSYLLRIDGAITAVQFNLSDYAKAYGEAVGKINSGTVTAVVKLLQMDAALYDFYSISNGFNDPLTMRTEKPVFTNVTNGLGFFGSAAEDSLVIQVYP